MLKHIFSRNNIIILLMGVYLAIPFNLVINKTISTLLISDMLVNLVIVCIFFTLISLNRYVLSFAFALFVLLNSSFFYMNYFMNVEINLNIVMAIFQTNNGEALEQLTSLSWKLIPFILITVALPIYLGFKYQTRPQKICSTIKDKFALLTFFIILILISLFTNLNKVKQDNDPRGLRYLYLLFNINIKEFPINYIYNVGKYISVSGGNFTFSKIPQDHKFTAVAKDKPYNIVLVIGETSRADKFSLAGYKRKTNPLLEKRKNLIYFNDFYSCNTGTIPSVSCLLGFKDGIKFRKDISKSLNDDIESVVPIFNNANFDTYLVSANSYKPKDPMFQRVKDVNSITYVPHSLGNKDEDLVPLLEKILNKKNIAKPNKLIILHTMGSHFKYSARYTKEFQKWEPICSTLTDRDITNCNKNYITNEYDNTILYVDYVLNSIMDSLNKSNTILIYASDHGESLGEYDDLAQRNIYYHGRSFDKAPLTQIHIPAIIWFSDSWIKNFGNQQYLNAKSKQNSRLNHNFISYSMLDCGFIESNFIDKSLSLCSSSAPKKVKIRNEVVIKEKIKVVNINENTFVTEIIDTNNSLYLSN